MKLENPALLMHVEKELNEQEMRHPPFVSQTTTLKFPNHVRPTKRLTFLHIKSSHSSRTPQRGTSSPFAATVLSLQPLAARRRPISAESDRIKYSAHSVVHSKTHTFNPAPAAPPPNKLAESSAADVGCNIRVGFRGVQFPRKWRPAQSILSEKMVCSF